MPDEVTILLTTPEAIMFRDFQQFHTTFALLISKGVFDTKNGSVTLNFDSNGQIKTIQRSDFLYSSKFD